MSSAIKSSTGKCEVQEVRSGRWTDEEERYAIKLAQCFESGTLLDTNDDDDLYSYLALKLKCDILRVQRKFNSTGPSNIKKRKCSRAGSDVSKEQLVKDQLDLQTLEIALNAKLEEVNRYDDTVKTKLEKARLNQVSPTSASSSPSSVIEDILKPAAEESSPKVSQQRGGRWMESEERYATKLMECFNEGTLSIKDGVRLVNFLAEKLDCEPVRVTRKFLGILGNRYCAAQINTIDLEKFMKDQTELQTLEKTFIDEMNVKESVKKSMAAAAELKRSLAAEHASASIHYSMFASFEDYAAYLKNQFKNGTVDYAMLFSPPSGTVNQSNEIPVKRKGGRKPPPPRPAIQTNVDKTQPLPSCESAVTAPAAPSVHTASTVAATATTAASLAVVAPAVSVIATAAAAAAGSHPSPQGLPAPYVAPPPVTCVEPVTNAIVSPVVTRNEEVVVSTPVVPSAPCMGTLQNPVACDVVRKLQQSTLLPTQEKPKMRFLSYADLPYISQFNLTSAVPIASIHYSMFPSYDKYLAYLKSQFTEEAQSDLEVNALKRKVIDRSSISAPQMFPKNKYFKGGNESRTSSVNDSVSENKNSDVNSSFPITEKNSKLSKIMKDNNNTHFVHPLKEMLYDVMAMNNSVATSEV